MSNENEIKNYALISREHQLYFIHRKCKILKLNSFINTKLPFNWVSKVREIAYTSLNVRGETGAGDTK